MALLKRQLPEFTEMYYATLIRKLFTSIVAAAIMMQSFSGAGASPCPCSAGGASATAQEACSVTGARTCCCSTKARSDRKCCCSQRAVSREQSESCCSSAACCQDKSVEDRCHCACSSQHPEPAVPADSNMQTVNWELFLSGLCAVSPVEQSKPSPGTPRARPETDRQSPNCSMQTLYCTWLT
jgi:hypothetical protein